MAQFCLPKEIADKLHDAATRGEIDIAKMYEMTSEQRRGLFEKYTPKETAQQINGEFEKAMISDQQTALKKWAETTFSGKEKKSAHYRDVIAKIDSLNELGVLTPKTQDAFLSDLVANELGATVTNEEAAIISEKAKKLQSLADQKSEFNTPSLEYFEAKKEMEDYLDSITPNSRVRVLTSTIGRGTMLASLKSPLLNIESNTVQAFTQAIERRLTNGQISGLNGDYGWKYMKFVNEVYKKTGYDISRMLSLESERKVLGEDKPNSQGPGIVRAVGRVYEDWIFKKTQGAPDVLFASAHFADSANLGSTKMAKEILGKGASKEALKQKALDIFKDATGILPTTNEGKIVRNQAILDAQVATYTDKNQYSDLALGLRKVFNGATGDLRLGDQLMPFVKTPANVIGIGIDSSGVLLPFDALIRLTKLTQDVLIDKEPFKESLKNRFTGLGRKIVRAGLGISAAYVLSTLFAPEDFVGEYPTSEKERQLLALKKATPNSVKIGGHWVSLDYFGPLGAPLVGMLYAKKYGKDFPSTVLAYYKGVGKQAAKIPGFTEFFNTVESINQGVNNLDQPVEKQLAGLSGDALDYIRARSVPAGLYDYAKATDDSQRQIDYTSLTDSTVNAIPELRKTLPEKKNIFGETIETQGWKTLLFGERVKTAANDPVVDELVRLDGTGNLPSITDVAKTSPRAKDLKKQIGDKLFEQAMVEFGQAFKSNLSEFINSSDYQNMEDDQRANTINKIKNGLFNAMLSDYGYEKPPKEGQ